MRAFLTQTAIPPELSCHPRWTASTGQVDNPNLSKRHKILLLPENKGEKMSHCTVLLTAGFAKVRTEVKGV